MLFGDCDAILISAITSARADLEKELASQFYATEKSWRVSSEEGFL